MIACELPFYRHVNVEKLADIFPKNVQDVTGVHMWVYVQISRQNNP